MLDLEKKFFTQFSPKLEHKKIAAIKDFTLIGDNILNIFLEEMSLEIARLRCKALPDKY